jgi:hypothetical protein
MGSAREGELGKVKYKYKPEELGLYIYDPHAIPYYGEI